MFFFWLTEDLAQHMLFISETSYQANYPNKGHDENIYTYRYMYIGQLLLVLDKEVITGHMISCTEKTLNLAFYAEGLWAVIKLCFLRVIKSVPT